MSSNEWLALVVVVLAFCAIVLVVILVQLNKETEKYHKHFMELVGVSVEMTKDLNRALGLYSDLLDGVQKVLAIHAPQENESGNVVCSTCCVDPEDGFQNTACYLTHDHSKLTSERCPTVKVITETVAASLVVPVPQKEMT